MDEGNTVMKTKKSGSVERVRAALDAYGIDSEIERYDKNTRTAAEAAEAPVLLEELGCGRAAWC